ncbi:hypothetical protein HN388_06390 [bacterium]|nr:hypothetical protein [bacterium]MBT7310393.1 hypothetical protein [bacterium]
MKNNKILWVVAVILTLAAASWQRATGPTHPVRIKAEIGDIAVKAKLLRSHSTDGDLEVEIKVDDNSVTGAVQWRRLGAGDSWSYMPLVRDGELLRSALPKQKSAGKLEYTVHLKKGEQGLTLDKNDQPIVARFKDPVPAAVLIPHIFCMFFGLIWAMRTGLGAIFASELQTRRIAISLGMLSIGGLILGPVVQKYAFGAYWTGWPLGGDWTDNKLALMVLAWLIAMILSVRKQALTRVFVIVALLVTLTVYLIPHSMGGSTLDYSTGETVTGKQQ